MIFLNQQNAKSLSDALISNTGESSIYLPIFNPWCNIHIGIKTSTSMFFEITSIINYAFSSNAIVTASANSSIRSF